MSSTYPRRIVASTVWSFCFTYRAAPVLMGCTAVFTLSLGLVPSAQVLLIERLAVSVDHGPREQAYVWALFTGLLTASYLAAGHVMYALQRMTQIVATAAARVQIAESYASLDPVEIVDQEVQSTARAAREAVNEKEVALQATSGLSLVFSLVVVVSLAITIGRSSWLSALSTIGCLVPLSLSAIWYARQDLVAWPKINEARRHAAVP